MNSLPGLYFVLLLASVFFHFPAFSTVLPTDTITTRNIKPIAEFKASLRDANGVLLKFKERKHLLKKQLQAIRQSPDKTKKEKVLLTILAVLAFVGVVSILGIIGYNGGAGLWPGAGLLISIFLLVFIIKRIWKKRKNNKS